MAPDEDIVRKVREGAPEAFGELMQRYEPKLRRYGRQFLSDADAIDDVVQESFIKAYTNMKSFDLQQRFSPWMYRIAHNTFVNALRSKSRSKIFSTDLDTLIPQAVTEGETEREWDERDVRAAIDQGLAKLPLKSREVLVLYYLEGLSYQEIADVLACPVGTVGVRLSRARTLLRPYLAPHLHESL